MSMKNSIDTIGNRTRDLPASVPQPTAPPLASQQFEYCVCFGVLLTHVAPCAAFFVGPSSLLAIAAT